MAHARALKFAGTSLREHRLYARISALALLLLSYLIAASSIDTWTVVRFAGSRGLPAAATAWHDPVFDKPLSFYLFDLPFYAMLRGYVLALVIVCILVYWVAARGWQLRYRLPDLRESRELDPAIFRLEGGLESQFLRGAGVVLLLAMAVRFFLGRYEMVYNEHGSFLVGIDYVDQNIGLPLQWLLIVACLAAAVFVLVRAAGCWPASMAAGAGGRIRGARALVSALYVRPNEISLERPYIETHIHATRSAYGLEQQVKEIEFKAEPDAPIDASQAQAPARQRAPLGLARLPRHHHADARRCAPTTSSTTATWTATPSTASIARCCSRRASWTSASLPDASANWINPAFIYTHGYGLVLAEVSKITPDGLPVLLIENAPPEVKTPSLKLTRPEIYYGEVTHEPVFVNTAQEEFNYPSGEENVQSRYEGKGGFPISSLPMRLAAAIHEGEPNILLTNYFTANSRMMIHRKVRERLQELAGFLEWDHDPYLVITDAGRLVWMVDGYTTSDAHPYSRSRGSCNDIGRVNYIRNAVKATVDAYDGETHLYIFAPDDPHHRGLPAICSPTCSCRRREMPADLRRARALSRRRCSASRPKSTAPTTCSIRSRSTTRKTCGTWRARLRPGRRHRAGDADLRGGHAARRGASPSSC